MPYVNEEVRELLDPHIEELASHLGSVGDLNYTITRLTLWLLMRQGLHYDNMNNTFGTLMMSMMEMYRRIAAEYETVKMVENGDVPEFGELLHKIREEAHKHPRKIAADRHQVHG
jgi:hypothetical protein